MSSLADASTHDYKRLLCGTLHFLLPGGGHPHMKRREVITLLGGSPPPSRTRGQLDGGSHLPGVERSKGPGAGRGWGETYPAGAGSFLSCARTRTQWSAAREHETRATS